MGGGPAPSQENPMPEGARWRARGPLKFAFHFGTEPWRPQLPDGAIKVFGPDELHRADSSCWYVKGG
jgi:hypothetical protein